MRNGIIILVAAAMLSVFTACNANITIPAEQPIIIQTQTTATPATTAPITTVVAVTERPVCTQLTATTISYDSDPEEFLCGEADWVVRHYECDTELTLESLITTVSPVMELEVTWFFGFQPEYEEKLLADRNNFLQQFDSYIEFDKPHAHGRSWLIFNANRDLYEFQFFRLSLACAPWGESEWLHLYPDFFHYRGGTLASQAVLHAGIPMVVPWTPGCIWPTVGISFLDETGQKRNFTVNHNLACDGPPMIIMEFLYGERCDTCANIIEE